MKMNPNATVIDTNYSPPEEKCLSEAEEAAKQISECDDSSTLDVESNFSEQEVSKERKCFENVVVPVAPSTDELQQQPGSWHCTGSGDGQFFIALDASTVAAIKGGAHYTLVPVEGEKTKTSAEPAFGNENADPNKPSSCGNIDVNKPIRLQMPISTMTTQLTPAHTFPHSFQPELDDIIKTTVNCSESESVGVSDDDNKASSEEKCKHYSIASLNAAASNAATKEDNSEREKECVFTSGTTQGTEFPAFGDCYKELTYAPLITKVSRVKHEAGLQSCVNMITPRRSPYGQQSCDGAATSPATLTNTHLRHSRILRASGSIPTALRRPYPYHTGKASYGRGFQVRPPWATCIPQTSSVQVPQMIFPTPLNVTPASSPSPSTASNASGVTLNSSGEEARQDSSPEYPRVPFNTPNSNEVDVSTLPRVNFAPDGQQLAQYLRDVDNNMKYYIPFSVREDHNQKERERRSRIKASCHKLRALIPGLNEKTDKATVFEYAASYLDFLKMKVDSRYDKEFLEHKFSYQ